MFSSKLFGFKKEKRARITRADVINEQVKKILTQDDQKIILMVRN